jgi:hypothetical protein
MSEELRDILGFIILGLLGLLSTKLIGIDFQSYMSFIITGMLYLLYKIYEESK